MLVWCTGKGRGLRTTCSVKAGTLLLVARPAASVTAGPGSQPQPHQLASSLAQGPTSGHAAHSLGMRQALGLLCDGSAESMRRATPGLADLVRCRFPDGGEAAASPSPSSASTSQVIDLNAYGEPWGDGEGSSLDLHLTDLD